VAQVVEALRFKSKVSVSILDGVVGIFHWHNPSSPTMAQRLTQPPLEMSTRNIFWGLRAAGAQGWQPYHLHVPTVLKSGNLSLLEPSGPVQTCNVFALPFYETWGFGCNRDSVRVAFDPKSQILWPKY
jgi:hypothetical protein